MATDSLAFVLASGGGVGGWGGVVVLGAVVVLGLMLVALGSYAYKQVRGEGVEWPDEGEREAEEGGVERGSSDDEWDYY